VALLELSTRKWEETRHLYIYIYTYIRYIYIYIYYIHYRWERNAHLSHFHASFTNSYGPNSTITGLAPSGHNPMEVHVDSHVFWWIVQLVMFDYQSVWCVYIYDIYIYRIYIYIGYIYIEYILYIYVCMSIFADFNFTGSYFFQRWNIWEAVFALRHGAGPPKMPSVIACNTRNHESKYIYDHICIVTPLVLAAHLQMHIYIFFGYLHRHVQ